jgi:hypothetical protein
VKIARVSYTDLDGIEHAITVEARSLFHAVGIAIARFRLSQQAGEPGSLTKFTVEPREISVLHTVTRKHFDDWLARPSGTPAETAQRDDLRILLESSRQSAAPRRRQRWH